MRECERVLFRAQPLPEIPALCVCGWEEEGEGENLRRTILQTITCARERAGERERARERERERERERARARAREREREKVRG